jgi:hypothetical protein
MTTEGAAFLNGTPPDTRPQSTFLSLRSKTAEGDVMFRELLGGRERWLETRETGWCV